jgi:hypothetical protein
MELATTYRYVRRDSLEDYPATIICARGSRGQAWLDCGLQSTVSDPDFSTYGCGSSFEEAAQRCAQAIRLNAAGKMTDSTGKTRRVHGCLTGYDLHYRLMPHWERKLVMARLGDDPNEALRAIAEACPWENWPLRGEWLDRSKGTKHLEFFFQVCLSIGRHRCKTASEAEAFGLETADAVLAEIKEHLGRSLSTVQITHPTVRARATRSLLDHLGQQEHHLVGP